MLKHSREIKFELEDMKSMIRKAVMNASRSADKEESFGFFPPLFYF